ncbi:trypsin Inhibitor like cysteine rich domain protein, partial [Ostertagia ostertagi]
NTGLATSPRPTSVTCASTLCAEGTYCEDIDGRPQCLKIPACGANEEFRQCASCEPTCGPIVPCVPLCFPPACQCVGGYVRDNGKCIRRTDCTATKFQEKSRQLFGINPHEIKIAA